MLRDDLLARLADGRWHSGSALAERFGVTRGAVWKQVRALAALGLEVERVAGRGYRLAGGLQLLSSSKLRAALAPGTRARLAALEIHVSVDSTNARLLARDDALPAACLAEHQSAGRGRLGRRWVSPLGANLYVSVAWTFTALPRGVQALGLAIGVGVAEALEARGVPALELKWPNDLYSHGRKLGGVLVELRAEPPGRARAVVGVGLNVRMPPAAARGIDQPWTDLAAHAGESLPERNRLAAAVLDGVVATLDEFERDGFAVFAARWRARDALRDAAVEVETGAGQRRAGRAAGIDADGALLVDVGGAVDKVLSGDVRVRWR